MSVPATFNLTIYQGDTFSRSFQLVRVVGGEEVPIDLSEQVPLCQARLRPEFEDVIAQFDVSYIDAESGQFTIELDNERSRLLPRVSFYDIQTFDPVTGIVKTWLAGKILSPREVSRDYEDGN
jgi:hypothetical protein